MKEKKAFGKGYLEGYEAGLKEAWKDLIGLTQSGYSGREIRIVANSKREDVGTRVSRMRRALEAELGIPLVDAAPGRTVDGVSPAELRAGKVYLVESKDLRKGAQIFTMLVDGDEDGMSITRTTPEDARDLYELRGRCIWLTRAELNLAQRDSAISEHVSPTELPALMSTIRGFIRETDGRVVMLEGLDYLILNNNMDSVRKFLNSMKDEVYLAKAVLLICIDPARMKGDDVVTLRSEVDLSL